MSQEVSSSSVSRLEEPTTKGFSRLGGISHRIDAHVTMPIVPCAPWISLCQEATPGPYGAFCTPPTAHCSFTVPGPAACPVLNSSPLPKITSTQAKGSDISH